MIVPLAFVGGAIGMSEILLVLFVLLLLFGAHRLPSIARSLGRTIEEFRRAARSVSREIIRGSGDDGLPRPPAGDSPPPASGERPG